MKMLERELLLELKDCFWNIIDENSESYNFEHFVSETLHIILKIFGVETVTLYKYENWENQFELIGCVSRNGIMVDNALSISFKELKKLLDCHDVIGKPLLTSKIGYYDLLIKVQKDTQLLGFVCIKDAAESILKSISDEGFRCMAHEYSIFLGKVQNLSRIITEEKKYKQLFRVTEKFHSFMNMDHLLGEIIHSLQDVYPVFSHHLLLSHDNHYNSDLPIKDLEYDNENLTAMESYVTGTVQFEDGLLSKHSTLYAPLKGKQGVYGVLVVAASNKNVFPRTEVEFISLLANTAGSALENIQLYQQSKKLISDLQLINETSQWLNSNLRLSDTIQYMSDKIKKSFDAQEVGFFLYSPNDAIEKILSGSTAFFSSKLAKEYIAFVKEKIQKEGESLFIGDLSLPKINGSFRSVIAIPMDFGEQLKGIAIIMHQEPYFFSFDTFKLLQSLIHHSTLAFTNSMLREELEKMIITDHLTKLNSRNYLDEKIQRSMKEDEQGTFILIDIDDFKQVNDTYGHQIGDEILVQVADIIKNNIREDDIGARWGGEELVIYLPKVDLKVGVSITNRILEKVSENSKPHVTISCGISYWHQDISDSYNYLFKRADEALYIAKGSGKNKAVTQEENIKVS